MITVLKKRGKKFGWLEYFRYLRSPEVAITVAAIAACAVFYARLQAKRASAAASLAAQLDSPESALMRMARGSGSGGGGATDKPAEASANTMAEYGQSSVRYVDGRVEPPEGGRVFYDDVGKGAGQTVKGVLRLADARKLPVGVDYWENEFKEALKKRNASAAGGLPGAESAKDPLSPNAGASYGASASVQAPAFAESPAAGGPSPAQAAQAQGGQDLGTSAVEDPGARVHRAEDPERLLSQEMPEGTSMLASAQAASALQGAGELMGRLAAFGRASGVQRVDQPITLPLSTLQKIAIYQLTTTEVYGLAAAQHRDETEFETSTEETGLVFDGKVPKCRNCTISGPGGAPSVGGGAMNSDLLEQALQTSAQVQSCSGIAQQNSAAQETLTALDSSRKNLLTGVAACRDKNHTAYLKGKALAACRCDSSPTKAKDFTEYLKKLSPKCKCPCKIGCCCCKCNREEQEWANAKSAAQICPGGLAKQTQDLMTKCGDFNAKAEILMELMKKCGSMPKETATTFSCPDLMSGAPDRAKECFIPDTGPQCGPY